MEPADLAAPAVKPHNVEGRIRWASSLIVAGLVVQLGSLLVIHPLAFVAFLCLGCPLIAAGIVVYLFSLVHRGESGHR